MNNVSINSEIGPLKKVMIHRPDPSIEAVTPSMARKLLFDDSVSLPLMQTQHDLFTNVLRATLGPDAVFDAQDLLVEVLANDAIRHDLVVELCAIEQCSRVMRAKLFALKPSNLVLALLTGDVSGSDQAVFPPLPNFIFTRDIAAAIGTHVVVSTFAKQARKRESLLTQYILYHHQLFADTPKIEVVKNGDISLAGKKAQKKAQVTIEGGDIMMWAPRHLFVGCGERTSPLAIKQLLKYVFDADLTDSITCVFMQKKRSSMHLDTICTRISETEYVAYAPLISKDGMERDRLKVIHYEKSGKKKKYPSLEQFIESIIPDMTLVKCGNGEYRHDEREQWTDGCNFLALRPGFIIGYDRNTRTTKALFDQGYNTTEILTPSEVVNPSLRANFDSNKKIVVLLKSSELSRARGGPRCMSFPILRDELT